MGFTVDYSKAEQKHNVQDGEYEVIIRGASFNTIHTTGTETVGNGPEAEHPELARC